MPVCKNCKGTDFERDLSNANNDLVCKNCGVVSEDNPIVSEVTFGESSSGAAIVQGSFVGAEQAHASFGPGSGALESREATLNSARRKLRAVSFALNIPEYVTDAAFQWYKLALSNNFVRGRRSQNVIAACLYVACRKEKTHHMLIDFSSRLQVSVYSIGATYLQMVKKLHITDVPMVDPSLFIQHYAEKLDLGDKKVDVVKDAVKLSHRMQKDWIYEGRRPAGVAGACILLACRMNNLRRTHTEIVAVSHVAEETIQKRLEEFRRTKAAKLSIKAFRDTDDKVDVESRPPSYFKNRVNERLIKAKLQMERENEMSMTSEEALDKNPILSQFMTAQELSSKEVLYFLKRFSERRDRDIRRIKATHGIDDEDLKLREGDVRHITETVDLSKLKRAGAKRGRTTLEKSKARRRNRRGRGSGRGNDSGSDSDNDSNSEAMDRLWIARRLRRMRQKEETIPKRPKTFKAGDDNFSDSSLSSSSDDFLYESDYNSSPNDEIETDELQKRRKLKEELIDPDYIDEVEGYAGTGSYIGIRKAGGNGISAKMKSGYSPQSQEYFSLRDVKRRMVTTTGRGEDGGTEIDVDPIDGYSLENDPYRPKNLHLLPKTDEILGKVRDDAENLEDADDSELEGILLDEEASKLKERVWLGLNEEFLLEQENKRLKEEADQLAGNGGKRKRRPGAKKRKTASAGEDSSNGIVTKVDPASGIGLLGQLQDKSSLQAALKAAEERGDATAANSVRNMLQKAIFSKKINYDAIDGLFK